MIKQFRSAFVFLFLAVATFAHATTSLPWPGPGTPASSGGTWTSIVSNALSGGDRAGFAGYTLVQMYPQASLAATGGTQIRVTIKASSATGGTITGLYVGQCAAGYTTIAPSFSGTPTQLFVAGSGTITVGSGGATTLTDAASFVMPSSNGLCISWQYNASAASFSGSTASTPANWHVSWKLGADAATVTKASYTDYTANTGAATISLVEELI